MRYAQIRYMDISNGENIGVSLFVQGCCFEPHCKGCFNPETWDFNNGNRWTEDVQKGFFDLINKPYIKRVSILGGEPLSEQHLSDLLNLILEIRTSFPNKTIWLYTGYTWEQIMYSAICDTLQEDYPPLLRQEIIKNCDVLVDGRYVDGLRNITLKWRGSSNQRVIDVQKSLQEKKIILYCD